MEENVSLKNAIKEQYYNGMEHVKHAQIMKYQNKVVLYAVNLVKEEHAQRIKSLLGKEHVIDANRAPRYPPMENNVKKIIATQEKCLNPLDIVDNVLITIFQILHNLNA